MALGASATLDGLDAAIADENLGDVLELRALVLGTIAEGLHRRLFDDEVRFPTLTTAQKKAVRKAGREALAQAVNGFGEAASPDDFKDLIAGFNDVRARQRFETLKACVDDAVRLRLSTPSRGLNTRTSCCKGCERPHWVT